MAVAKVVALLLLFALVLTTGVFSDEEPTTTPGSASEIQLEQLHAKIHTLGFASFSLNLNFDFNSKILISFDLNERTLGSFVLCFDFFVCVW